jgi:hypothetical protein
MKQFQFKDLGQFQRAAYIMLLFFWLLRAYQGVWLSQLACPLFISVQADNFYWFLHLLGLPQFFLQHYWAALSLDIGILSLLLLLIYNVYLRWAAVLYFLASLLYFVSYHSALMHHTHSLVPVLVLSMLLCVKTPANWKIWQPTARYYACGAMLAAALWKLSRGTAFDTEQLADILQNQHQDLLYTQAQRLYAQIYTYLIAHPNQAFLLWQLAFWLEFSFIIGFFSRRYDAYLAVALIVFVVADYFLMSLYFFEFGLFAFFFVPIHTHQHIKTSEYQHISTLAH